MTKQELARQIRLKVDDLNQAIREAHEQGVRVAFSWNEIREMAWVSGYHLLTADDIYIHESIQ